MLFSYNWLQSFFKEKLPLVHKLADSLTMHSFEVEEVEKKGKDWVLDIDILTNRGADCFSHWGIAREISALFNMKLKYEFGKVKEVEEKSRELLDLEIKNREDCSRYTAKVIKNVRVNPSPKWIRDRLKVLGLKPINNVVDITNYVMLETGQPLHAFDLDKIRDQKIIVRRAKKGEKILTLDNEQYALDKDILVIADSKSPLAIAGIKGGRKAEIDKKTKRIVLESANFNPSLVRHSSKKIDLRTDASWRFEHGLDMNLTEIALNRASFLIKEFASGKVCQGLVDFYPKKAPLKSIKLELNRVDSLLGIKIPPNKMKNILLKLGFKIKKATSSYFIVEIPSLRLDVSIQEDLIEEIGRIYGYEKIPAVLPNVSLRSPEKNFSLFWENMAKDILKEMGFSEIYSNSFINQQDADLFGYKPTQLIETENPISADYQYLRPSLIPLLLKSLSFNQKFFKEVKIFESGKIFRNKADAEEKALTILMTGHVFYQAKGIVDLLLNKFGISQIWYDQYKATPEESESLIWNQNKCAEIKIDGKEIGFLGEISSRITEGLKLKSAVVIIDLDFEKMQKMISEEQEFEPISPYPSAVRDIAVLVPRDILVEEVLNVIEVTGQELIRDVDLFDIYEGEETGEGKKNLAFHIIYQAEDRTLSSKEIDDVQERITKALEEKDEWEVRK